MTRAIMVGRLVEIVVAVSFAFAPGALAAMPQPPQTRASGAQPGRILVMPFEHAARGARIYWLAEASSVLLAEDLDALGTNAISREERLRAFERLQVPRVASLSRATIIRIGQLVGASEIIIGSLELQGEVLEVRARRLRLDSGHLDAELVDRGPLAELFVIFERLARRLTPASTPRVERTDKNRPMLAAFEQYVKGLLAETPATQAGYLQAALKLSPGYDRAWLALWDLYEEQGDHVLALQAALAVSENSPRRRDAQFFAAYSLVQLKRYDEAYAVLRRLLDERPAAAVFNNLGVVQIRRGSTPHTGRATYYFNKAAESDPDDFDYFFNLGYAYWVERDLPAAIYWLRETVRRNPADGDAHFVLGASLQAAGNAAEAAREKALARQLSSSYDEWERRPAAVAEPVPRGLERLKIEPELPHARRLEATLIASEQREQREVASFHLERGRRLYEQETDREAIAELRRALYLSPYHAEAHLLLGRLYLRTGRVREAIDTLKISVWSEETAAAHVALGEALLANKDEAAARSEAQRALALDPGSIDARRLLDKLGPASPP